MQYYIARPVIKTKCLNIRIDHTQRVKILLPTIMIQLQFLFYRIVPYLFAGVQHKALFFPFRFGCVTLMVYVLNTVNRPDVYVYIYCTTSRIIRSCYFNSDDRCFMFFFISTSSCKTFGRESVSEKSCAPMPLYAVCNYIERQMNREIELIPIKTKNTIINGI